MCSVLNEILTDSFVIDNKVVQIEPNHSCINITMLCYDDDSMCTPVPSLVEFINDNSSADSPPLLGTLPISQHLRPFKWRLTNPITITTDQKCPTKK